MATILKFPVRVYQERGTHEQGARRAVAFYYSPKQLTPEHHPIQTPLGTVYIRVQVTPAQDLADVFDHVKEISDDECFMNGHWVMETQDKS